MYMKNDSISIDTYASHLTDYIMTTTCNTSMENYRFTNCSTLAGKKTYTRFLYLPMIQGYLRSVGVLVCKLIDILKISL